MIELPPISTPWYVMPNRCGFGPPSTRPTAAVCPGGSQSGGSVGQTGAHGPPMKSTPGSAKAFAAVSIHPRSISSSSSRKPMSSAVDAAMPVFSARDFRDRVRSSSGPEAPTAPSDPRPPDGVSSLELLSTMNSSHVIDGAGAVSTLIASRRSCALRFSVGTMMSRRMVTAESGAIDVPLLAGSLMHPVAARTSLRNGTSQRVNVVCIAS